MPPSSSRIPSLLQPYIQGLPQGSLHLLTSVLGASANWLLIRYISGALGDVQPANGRRADDQDGTTTGLENETAVVLVSFLRDWDFWRAEARRGAGLDLARLAQQNRFVFVDGLSSLFLPAEPENGLAKSTAPAPPPTGTLPVRGPRTVNPRGQPLPTHTPAAPQPRAKTVSSGGPVIPLASAAIEHLESTLSSVISSLSAQGRRIHLLLDSPDLLVAATASSAPSAAITPSALNATILSLRAQVHAVTVAVAADTPLMGAASDASAFASGLSSTKQHAPLETRHAGLVLSLAHVADWTLSLRLLDTGFAADVSGVVRITRGDNQEEDEDDGEEEAEGPRETWEREETRREEKELLYHVAGDGGVKVFERGAGGGAGHG